MKTAFDSSAFAKRYVEEQGSHEVNDILAHATELGLSVLCLPEISSALNRRLREGSLQKESYASIRTRLLLDINDAQILNLTPTVIARSLDLLENNILRAMDALHVACAIEWQADLFVTSDRRQALAAQKFGLRTREIKPGLSSLDWALADI